MHVTALVTIVFITQRLVQVVDEMNHESEGLRLGLGLSDDYMAQDLIVMFLDFAAIGLEDIIDMSPFSPSIRPAGCRTEQFLEYCPLRVIAGMLAILHPNPTGMDDLGEFLGF